MTMLLQYTNVDETTIQATLDAGESLGNHAGPLVCYVPCDPGNKEFQAIVESGEPIAPYEPPPAPTPEPVTLPAHPEGPMDAATKQSVEAYVLTQLRPMHERIAALERRLG